MFTPPFLHWYVKGPVPEATTVKVAEPPAVVVCDCSWVVMVGAEPAERTDRVTAAVAPL